MATHTHPIRSLPAGARRVPVSSVRWFAAPVVAVVAGMLAQWADFQALRVPLLLFVGFGVLATAHAATRDIRGLRDFATAIAIGIATWALAESVYAVLHVSLGERFHADRFGPQWSQALGLIAAHGLFLGAPTGIVAALLLRLPVLSRHDR